MKVEARTVLAVGAVAIAGYVVWKAVRAAGNAVDGIGNAISDVAALPGKAWAVIGPAIASVGVDYAQATDVVYDNPYGIQLTPAQQATYDASVKASNSWSMGSALYDWMHPGDGAAAVAPTNSGGGGVYAGNGATGGW